MPRAVLANSIAMTGSTTENTVEYKGEAPNQFFRSTR